MTSVDEVIPWKALKGVSITSLTRIAKMLSAVMHDDEGNPTGCAWGTAGQAISEELLNYCDFAEGIKKRRDDKKARNREKQESDPRFATAKQIVKQFVDECKQVMQAPPPNMNWGWSIKQTYELIEAGWDAELLKKLVPVFFDCRTDKGYIFRQGAFADFVSNVLRLKAVYDEQGGGPVAKPSSLC